MARAPHWVCQEAFIRSASRKLMLQATCWRPTEVQERAAIVVAHHLGGHSGRLNTLGEFLTKHGISVIGHDMQGWGRSESYLQYTEAPVGTDTHYAVKSEEQLVADFDKLTTRIMQYYTAKGADIRFPLSRMVKDKKNPWDPEPPIAPRIPVFVLGHGVGAPIVSRYLADRVEPDHEKKAGLGGAVLAAPWIGYVPELNALQSYRLLEEFIVNYFPHSKFMGAEPDPSKMFDDIDEVVAWEKDSIIAKVAIPARTVRIINKLSKQANETLGTITLPTLVLAGSADEWCPPQVAADVAERLGSSDATIADIPDTKHDLFRSSPITDEFALRLVLEWMEERIGTYSVPSDPYAYMSDDRRREILARYEM